MSKERIYRLLYGKSLRYLGLRMRSELEMRKKLEEWSKGLTYGEDGGASEVWLEVIERILGQLKKETFLNDRKFAWEWVRSRLKSGKRGPEVIKMELRTKGIAREVVEDVLAEINESEDAVSELEGARTAADKYIRRLIDKPPKEQSAKLYAHLAGKRFSEAVIRQVIKEKMSS
ncbi:MAG: regulatory protein RecX [Patescibacteria group bacterium]|nr:MAG: regulatory protein RecX [Patescibacteria group bacterium]